MVIGEGFSIRCVKESKRIGKEFLRDKRKLDVGHLLKQIGNNNKRSNQAKKNMGCAENGSRQGELPEHK